MIWSVTWHVSPGPTSVGSAAGLRVRVDLDLCQGHGVCVSEASEIFALDPKETRVRVLDERPAPGLRAKLEAAVRHCPTRAISILED